MAERIDGRTIARLIEAELSGEAEALQRAGKSPRLAAVLVGDDPASHIYVRNKERACRRVGLESRLIRLPAETSREALLGQIDQLNADSEVHGILVQLPLPAHLDARDVLDRIDPLKDVDAFHADNVGRIAQGRPRFLPCTPFGVLQLLARNALPVAGKRVTILGRSDIVGKPLALLLVQRDSPLGPDYANATVTVCHSRTPNLAERTREADVLIAAVGKPKLITAEMVKPGAVVIDVGTNRVGDRVVGDVDFDAVEPIAGHITPVPGGVGPMTIAMLLANTLAAARLARDAAASPQSGGSSV